MPIGDLLLVEFDEEMKKTRTMLERVPEDKKDFAPHPRSMPLNKARAAHRAVGQLWSHDPDHARARFLQEQLQTSAFESAAQLVAAFDEGAAKARAALKNTPMKLDPALEAEFRRQAHLQRIALPGLPPNVPQSRGPPPRPTRSLSAHEREAGPINLRPFGGRHDGVLAAFNLPDDLNRIAREPGIGRDDRPSFFDALRDKQAVERVTMMERQRFNSQT